MIGSEIVVMTDQYESISVDVRDKGCGACS
jgi:hypothetical protein